MFEPIQASKNIKDEFAGYIETTFHIADKEYRKCLSDALKEDGVIAKGPYLEITDSYQTGKSMEELIDEGELSPLFRSLEGDVSDGEKELQLDRPLYQHQEQAIRKINQGKNLIVTTGTGSGKTECFLIPILNHLLREEEQGELQDGVRAIIIYPMNALANDQMKRLRNLLKDYPSITFGVYNSSTEYTHIAGVTEYGKIYKDENGNPLAPLRNEIISRQDMQEAPPHILITNYAMLEYMMLRPKDDAVFSGAQLHFLVLDEAHIYRGATGMETALLLKRLKARISEPDNVLHILTSATLGGKEVNADIVKFGETLCSSSFFEEDIVRAQSIAPNYDGPVKEVPLSLFTELAAPKRPLNEIVEDYGIDFPSNTPDAEFLYDLCSGSSVYRKLRDVMTRPMIISDIVNEMSGDITGQDIVNVISVASQASKNNTPLIKAHYHLFTRALEGAYITIGPDKYLTLNRKTSIQINGDERKLFECSVCNDCGRLAVVGQEVGGKLEFIDQKRDDDANYYLLIDSKDSVFEGVDDEEDEDEDDEENTEEQIGKNDMLLCMSCGAIFDESLRSDPPCSCGNDKYIKVRKAKKRTSDNEGKCPVCGKGHFRSFYLGYDAATSVLTTSLFEELPENEVILKSKTVDTMAKKSLFGSPKSPARLEMSNKARQFLTFSDNRSDAAYFASYMSSTYQEFLRRRGIWHIVDEYHDDMIKQPWEIVTFVNKLTDYFSSHRTFAEPGQMTENLTSISEKNAWIAILNEMVNARRSTSLVSLGVIQFQYRGNTEEIMGNIAEKYSEDVQTMKALFDLLVMDIVYFGAVEGECVLNDDDREYIYYTHIQKYFKRCKDPNRDKKKSDVKGWMASSYKNGNLRKNSRLIRVMKALALNQNDANDILQNYWDNVLILGEFGLTPARSDKEDFYFSTQQFTISAVSEDAPIYRCNVCGKTTTSNCKNMCPIVGCNGHLEQISPKSLQSENHFAKLYSSDLMDPLHIKEHTAQLGRSEQQKYQDMFIRKELNALSCSTTFELGVDVGDLETVYMRDMPPSPANYVQRAGRAGRGKNAAAFALTYAKLGSHDFTFFNKPEDMITGKIKVPVFTLKNEKVIQRHIFAVALSAFFAQNVDVYNENDADIFLNQDGWERLCDYLNDVPSELTRILKASIPENMHEQMGIADNSWTSRLIGENGVLRIAVEDFRDTIEYFEKEIKRLERAKDYHGIDVAQQNLKKYRRSKDDKKGKNELIEFLVRNNVLPKYGFPVDTVELYQNTLTAQPELQMVRDLQLAVSEYAPDSEVVANDRLYTSRYIKKSPRKNGQDWESVYIAKCSNADCNTWNYSPVLPDDTGKPCVSCHKIIETRKWKEAIEPRSGFVAESKSRSVPMRKPEQRYRSDVYYVGDTSANVTQKYNFKVRNGNSLCMETSNNDSLMVICNDEFFVCPQCGYAECVTEKKKKDRFNKYENTIEKEHETRWGKTCTGKKLKRNKLCHVFKTDVVHITFQTSKANDQDVMLSVLYALLEALSSTLDIERNDIAGCLHKVRFEGKLIYTIVLYDTVAGGAGHVHRMVTEDGKVFENIVHEAIKHMMDCDCSPSCYNCLRNYYNQKIHDRLDRVSAYTFLEDYEGEPIPISADEENVEEN